MIALLRELARRRELLVERSQRQRDALRARLQPAVLRAAAAETVIGAASRVVVLAVRLAPLYTLLLRRR